MGGRGDSVRTERSDLANRNAVEPDEVSTAEKSISKDEGFILHLVSDIFHKLVFAGANSFVTLVHKPAINDRHQEQCNEC